MGQDGEVVWVGCVTENQHIGAPHHRVDCGSEIGATGDVNIGQCTQCATRLLCSIDVLFGFLARIIRRFSVDNQQEKSPSINLLTLRSTPVVPLQNIYFESSDPAMIDAKF